MRLKGLEHIQNIYFIGIGGISMSALAKYLSVNGYTITGSDGQKGEETENLAFYGIRVYIGVDGARKELLSADAVVYTDAIPQEHAELCTAKQLGKKLFSRAVLLQTIASNFSHVITVAGSHGKTTCTSICAHILRTLGEPFTAHIGGEDSALGNFYTSGTDYFVTEACEYKKNMLKLRSDAAILLNIDKDHMECYKDVDELQASFYTYCERAKTAFICSDNELCRHFSDFVSFGILDTLADYRAVDIRQSGEKYTFTVEEYGKPLCRVKLKAIGKCNIYNALAAFACMRSFGFPEKQIADGIASFEAVKRRFERLGAYKGASFICDYAHHPREISSTVATAEGICKNNLYVVFQPHTYSRTRLLLPEFTSVLRSVKNLMIYKTYPAREVYDQAGSAETLAQSVGSCLYCDNVYSLKTWLKTTLRDGDVVLFLGAGDIYYTAQYLLKELH